MGMLPSFLTFWRKRLSLLFFFFGLFFLVAGDGAAHEFMNGFKKMPIDGQIFQGLTAVSADADSLRATVDEAERSTVAGNVDERIEKYTESIDRNPTDPILYFKRGSLHCHRVALSYFSTEADAMIHSPAGPRDSQSEPVERSAEPPSADSAVPCGLALDDFNRAIALNAQYAIFFYMRGVLLTLEACPHRNLEAALADFDEALRLNPANGAFYQERAGVRMKLEQFNQAINDMDQAILIEPSNYYFLYEKGLIQERMGDHENAADSYMRALFLAPNDRMPFLITALKGVRQDSADVLLGDFTSLIAKRPAASSLYVQRGMLFADEEKWKEAIDDFSRALSLRGDDPDVLFSRGKIYVTAGKKQDAQQDFQTACRQHHTAACDYAKITQRDVARGERWVPFWYSRDRRQYFYDREYLKNQQKGFRLIRVRVESEEDANEPDYVPVRSERPGYTLQWWEFRCSTSRFRIAKIRRFDNGGRLVESYPEYEKNFRPVLVDSISGKLADIVCGASGVGKATEKTDSSGR